VAVAIMAVDQAAAREIITKRDSYPLGFDHQRWNFDSTAESRFDASGGREILSSLTGLGRGGRLPSTEVLGYYCVVSAGLGSAMKLPQQLRSQMEFGNEETGDRRAELDGYPQEVCDKSEEVR
jgi:hypothetical protein